MKKIRLDYGKEGIGIELPAKCQATILQMKDTSVVENPAAVLKDKIARPAGTPPFERLCREKKTACIVVSDKTRPVPNKILLPPLLEVLEDAASSP